MAVLSFASAGAANAATQTARLWNSTSETQNRTSAGTWSTPMPTAVASTTTSMTGTYSTQTNLTTNVTYQGATSTKGCYLTASAAKVGSTYTFDAQRSPYGVSGGKQASCSATITSSNSSTGAFGVTFRVYGY